MILQWFFLIFFFITCRSEEVNLNFFQNDYDLKLEILECTWYDKSYYKYVNAHLIWHNRSQRAISLNFELRIDQSDKIILDLQLYKMMSNEYRFFPLTVKMNLCAEYKKNSFGIKDMVTGSSNIDPCDLKKNIPYAMNDVIPDVSKFPPRMPRGSYKLTLKFLFHSNLSAEADIYGRSVDKPIDWENIPKSKKTH